MAHSTIKPATPTAPLYLSNVRETSTEAAVFASLQADGALQHAPGYKGRATQAGQLEPEVLG
jgi:hypothetical protein